MTSLKNSTDQKCYFARWKLHFPRQKQLHPFIHSVYKNSKICSGLLPNQILHLQVEIRRYSWYGRHKGYRDQVARRTWNKNWTWLSLGQSSIWTFYQASWMTAKIRKMATMTLHRQKCPNGWFTRVGSYSPRAASIAHRFRSVFQSVTKVKFFGPLDYFTAVFLLSDRIPWNYLIWVSKVFGRKWVFAELLRWCIDTLQ